MVFPSKYFRSLTDHIWDSTQLQTNLMCQISLTSCFWFQVQNIPLQENWKDVGSVEEVNEDYLQRMSTSGQWGDGVMLASACRLYQRPIHVILDNKQSVVFSSSENMSKLPVYLGYLQRSSHYVHLTPRNIANDLVTVLHLYCLIYK